MDPMHILKHSLQPPHHPTIPPPPESPRHLHSLHLPSGLNKNNFIYLFWVGGEGGRDPEGNTLLLVLTWSLPGIRTSLPVIKTGRRIIKTLLMCILISLTPVLCNTW